MLSPEIRCVVGIDVAKSAHVVCALEAPGGTLRLKSTPIPATATGHAQLLAWLGEWGAGEPATLLIGVESTGSLWEPLYDALTQAGYTVVLLNPHQTAAWATSLGLRAKTDGIDAHTLARGLLAGWARASSVPDETVQALRTLTRTRRDLVQSQSAARQRLHDELVTVFPELVGHLPERADLGAPAVLRLLTIYSSAQVLAQVPLDDLGRVLEEASAGRWGHPHAQALQHLAQHSAASTRAVAARAVVVRTLAQHLLDLQARIADLEAALAQVLRTDPPRPGTCRGRCRAWAPPGRPPSAPRWATCSAFSGSTNWSPPPAWSRARMRAGAFPASGACPNAGQENCAMRSTWRPWSRCASAPSGAPVTSACWIAGGPRRRPSRSSRASCSRCSTICCVRAPPTIPPSSPLPRWRGRLDIRYELFLLCVLGA
jgi:hypothetical protein